MRYMTTLLSIPKSPKMASHKTQLLCVTVLLTFFFLNSSSYAEKPAPKPSESYKFVIKFCNTRSTNEDREFCIRVLKSHPNSTSVRDNISSLLKISVDLAIPNLKKTEEFMTILTKSKGTKTSLIPVLEECISAFDGGIGQLRIIYQELIDDPPTASYDALMAHDELIRCENSLNNSKIVDGPVLSRYTIAKAYVELCVDIGMVIDWI